jgi:hypothetical protein
MIQPDLIQNFRDEVKVKSNLLTPGIPSLRSKSQQSIWMFLMRIIREDKDLGLGCLCTRQSILVFCHIVLELSKCMDSEIWGTYDEFLRVLKFVFDNKNLCLKVQPKLDYNLGWNLKIFGTAIVRVIPKQE